MTMRINLICTIIFSIFLTWRNTESQGDHWRYFGIYGVTNWSAIYFDCDEVNHTRQSPVDIVSVHTELDNTLTEVDFAVTFAPNDAVIFVNNGHTVSFNYNGTAVRILGGHLDGNFRIGGIHFHWGSRNDIGSEHTFDGIHFPMEMHIVTYDETRYRGVIEASSGVNSIAVLGVLFELSEVDDPVLDPIVHHLGRLTVAGNQVNFPFFDPHTLLPEDTRSYYRYLGSLTTPPCAESVVWTVFRDTLTISGSQLNEFRKLQEMIEPDGTIDYLNDNWRPVQLLHERHIKRSFQSSASEKTLLQVPLLILAAMPLMLSLVS